MRMSRFGWMPAAAAVVALAAAPGAAWAGQTAGAATAGSAQAGSADQGQAGGAPITNLSLDKIRLAVDREPTLDLTQNVRFYSLIEVKAFEIEKLLGGERYDLVYGATRGGAAMTHTEFLKRVTPEELYSSAGIKAEEMLQWSVVNVVGHAILRKLLTDLKEARTERERREIQERIERELEAIRRGGGL